MTGYIPPAVNGVSSLLWEAPALGEFTAPRWATSLTGSGADTSGSILLGYFRALKSENVNSLGVYVNTAHTGAPTLQRIGLYSVDPATGNLAIVCQTASDTTIGAATGERVRATTAQGAKVKGNMYALAFIGVGGTTQPSLMRFGGGSAPVFAAINRAQRTCGHLTGQADLPANINDAALDGAIGQGLFGLMLP